VLRSDAAVGSRVMASLRLLLSQAPASLSRRCRC
jgi:hypothetical protein